MPYLVESLSVVDTYHRTDHLWHDDHISQVRADWLGLFTTRSFFFGLAQLLDERQGLPLQTSLKSAEPK